MVTNGGMLVNMKNKKLLVLFSLIFIFSFFSVFLIGSIIDKYEVQHPSYYIKKKTGINIDDCRIKNRDEKRSGNGDGNLVIILNCNKNSISFKTKYWKQLPLSENLNTFMYGGVKEDGIIYDYNTAKENNIPKIKNGYYYFANKYTSNKNKYSDQKLFTDFSNNFFLMIYDTDNNVLYFLEYDS